MKKVILFITSLLILMSTQAVIIKNVSSGCISVYSYDDAEFWDCVSNGHPMDNGTWERKGIDKLSIGYVPKNWPKDCQSHLTERFENLTDDTVINFDGENSTVTQNS